MLEGNLDMHASKCVICTTRMPDWTETNPLRVVTGYHNVARNFFAQHGFEHVVLLSADGALEAAPLMGTADIILDLVRSVAAFATNHSWCQGCHMPPRKLIGQDAFFLLLPEPDGRCLKFV